MEQENLFSEFVAEYLVFKDKSILSPHYIPPKLPYRESEIKSVVKLMSPALKNEKPPNIFIYGKTGVGKTIVTRFVSGELLDVCRKKGIGLHVVYINNKVHDSKYRVLVKLLRDLWEQETNYFTSKGVKVHESGAPPSVLYETLVGFINDGGAGVVTILDEVDAVKDLDSLLYTLTRINDEIKKGFLAVVGISNNLFFKRDLDPRSKSTLCEEELVFPPYNAKQLIKIMKERVKQGFKEGVVDDSAVRLIAAVASKEGGDARYALRLLRKAGEIAEAREAKMMTTDDVEAAKKGVEEDVVLEGLSTLPDHQQVLLLTLANLTENEQRDLTGEKRTQFMSGEVYEEYRKLCRQIKEKPRSMRWIREYLNDLEMLGFVSMQFSGKGSRGQSRFIELGEDPQKIKQYVIKSLKLSS
ncbi:MAG: orc1/cdc6 family replication initiation protein [Candidatus Altiarchaeota archaeon]|nr:orc1/cdc6 family replication initiation protein [Candidatus Altiarchaeota archaeon]